jgi:hypothetical protein
MPDPRAARPYRFLKGIPFHGRALKWEKVGPAGRASLPFHSVGTSGPLVRRCRPCGRSSGRGGAATPYRGRIRPASIPVNACTKRWNPALRGRAEPWRGAASLRMAAAGHPQIAGSIAPVSCGPCALIPRSWFPTHEPIGRLSVALHRVPITGRAGRGRGASGIRCQSNNPKVGCNRCVRVNLQPHVDISEISCSIAPLLANSCGWNGRVSFHAGRQATGWQRTTKVDVVAPVLKQSFIFIFKPYVLHIPFDCKSDQGDTRRLA